MDADAEEEKKVMEEETKISLISSDPNQAREIARELAEEYEGF